MPKRKEAARSSLFFPTTTKTLREEEFEQYCSAEATGARLVNFISGVCGEAWRRLPDELREMYKLDLEKPDWLDPTYPHLAMNELHRIANQLPRYMPGKINKLDNEGWVVGEVLLSEKQTFAMRILIKVKVVVEAAGRIEDPASALLLIEASMNLGHDLAHATVYKYEPDVAVRIKSKQALDDHNNEVSSASDERNGGRKSRVEEIIAKDPSITSNYTKIAEALMKYEDEALSHRSLRRIAKNILMELAKR